MMSSVEKEYLRWCNKVTDEALSCELADMKGCNEKIEDAFFKALKFGTGGLRGVIGAGTNRMNIYTVSRACRGLAEYLVASYGKGSAVAIGYDTRHKSALFANVSAQVLSGYGITVHLFKKPLPTPILSYATRELRCNAGIMITASHNPSEYNGYKVYGADGCQITDTVAEEILKKIENLDYFDQDCKQKYARGEIFAISEALFENYLAVVSELSLLGGASAEKDISIVYTPLCGTGYLPVTEILRRNGYTNLTLVKEQATPDGNFPTCPYPNPELPEALEVGIRYAREIGADILIATDPDCDRVGVVIKDGSDYKRLTGNEVGLLLLEYIVSRRLAIGALPSPAVVVKTVVTTALAERIARSYGLELYDVLTGFKYIGEKIGELEAEDKKESFVFGFEESCGYLSGTHARDKDGVNAAFLVAEMFAYYKAQGFTPKDRLKMLYEKYGYSETSLTSYSFGGPAGAKKMQEVMQTLRGGNGFLGRPCSEIVDYKDGLGTLPPSDVLTFRLEDGCVITVRPSGTEPKMKIYTEVFGADSNEAKRLTEKLTGDFDRFIKSIDG